MRLDSEARRRDGVTLVRLRVTNDAPVARRVRVANRLDGPMWPPRREGYPAPGWDDGGYEGVLDPGETRALGYASPAPPADPPAEVAWAERAAGDADRRERTPATLVSDLGDPRPPAFALPDVDPGSAVPAAVERWLDDVAARLDADGAVDAADRRALAAVARRAGTLRERADG